MISQVECKFEHADANTPFSLTFLGNRVKSYCSYIVIIIFGKVFLRHNFKGSFIHLPQGVLYKSLSQSQLLLK